MREGAGRERGRGGGVGEARAGLALPLAACAAMNSPAISSALPPISPIMTIPLVCRSGGEGGRLRGRTGRGVAGRGCGCDGGTGGRADGRTGGRAGGRG